MVYHRDNKVWIYVIYLNKVAECRVKLYELAQRKDENANKKDEGDNTGEENKKKILMEKMTMSWKR